MVLWQSVVTGITTYGIHHAAWERVLTISSLFTYGLNTGGPGVMTVGWIIVSVFSMSRPTSTQTTMS